MKRTGDLFAELAHEVAIVREMLLKVHTDETTFAEIGAARSLLSQVGFMADEAAAAFGAERAIGGRDDWLDQFSAFTEACEEARASDSVAREGGAA